MESEVLRRFYYDTQNAIAQNVVGIAALLYQEGVVPEEIDDEAGLPKPPAERSATIMRNVRAAVKTNPQNFWVLVTVLEKFPVTASLANRMRETMDLHGERLIKLFLDVVVTFNLLVAAVLLYSFKSEGEEKTYTSYCYPR